jgi:hypothetical protein
MRYARRGHIILEALYQLYRFPTRDFVGDAIAYKIPLRVILSPEPDIGIVKMDTTIQWLLCPDISLKEILRTNLEMANQEELKRWREQLEPDLSEFPSNQREEARVNVIILG